MGGLTEQTYHFGSGILICPNGDEYKVTDITITIGPPIEIIEGGQVVRQEPGREPTRITFTELKDGTDQQTDDVHGHGEGSGKTIDLLPIERRGDSDQGQ